MIEKKFDFVLEKVEKIPETENKDTDIKITPVDKIYGYRYDGLSETWIKVDEVEKEYLNKKLSKKADYIQEIYKRGKVK